MRCKKYPLHGKIQRWLCNKRLTLLISDDIIKVLSKGFVLFYKHNTINKIEIGPFLCNDEYKTKKRFFFQHFSLNFSISSKKKNWFSTKRGICVLRIWLFRSKKYCSISWKFDFVNKIKLNFVRWTYLRCTISHLLCKTLHICAGLLCINILQCDKVLLLKFGQKYVKSSCYKTKFVGICF